jgi:hypothetical protein
MAVGADGCSELDGAPLPFWGKTPDPYANAYRIGALNCQRIIRNASLKSWFMIMCWLTPKSLEGSSEKFVIDKFGFSSQFGSGCSEDEDVENEEEDDLLVVTLHSRRDVEAPLFAKNRPLQGVIE